VQSNTVNLTDNYLGNQGMKNLVALALLLGCGVVTAAPVTWTFENTFFDDGAQITGSFDYDAQTLAVTDVDFWKSEGTVYGPTHSIDCVQRSPSASCTYTGAVVGGGDNMMFTFISAQFVPGWVFSDWIQHKPIGMTFDHSLTNAGGTIGFTQEGFLGSAIGPAGAESYIISGAITAVPIPAAVWLFGSALAGLGWFRRKTA
jgi:hypothetical protein